MYLIARDTSDAPVKYHVQQQQHTFFINERAILIGYETDT